ncbi:MAG: hypothetical protein MJB14_03730, partial [Spirochaetes bacterium]|nr:hypothetical protein [Spirochaetota bacterium]
GIIPFDNDLTKLSFFDYLPVSLGYQMIHQEQRSNCLILGASGGSGILRGLYYQFQKIDAVENLADISKVLIQYEKSGREKLYNHPNIQLYHQAIQSFIRETKKKYNLIELSLVDSVSSAYSGVSALQENFLYTEQSFQAMLNLLDEQGVLVIHRWLTTPPRDILKIMNILFLAMKQIGYSQPDQHVFAFRTIQTGTIIISKKPLSKSQINTAINFCKTRLFDPFYYSGIQQSEINQYIKLKKPYYYQAAQTLLSQEQKQFVNKYTYDIRTATTNRPYFYHFFKLDLMREIFNYGTSKIPFTEWGFLILIIFLFPILILSVVFIILPLFFYQKKQNIKTPFKFNVFAYFTLLGISFFMIEMPLIQKFVYLLSYPVYSFSIILGSLLISSGLGSYWSEKLFSQAKGILFVTIIIGIIITFYILFLDKMISLALKWPISFRIAFSLLLIMLPGFFMGIPFPLALSYLKTVQPESAKWALSINGFFSVISTILAAVIAVFCGFQVVLIIAWVGYLTAGLISLSFKTSKW